MAYNTSAVRRPIPLGERGVINPCKWFLVPIRSNTINHHCKERNYKKSLPVRPIYSSVRSAVLLDSSDTIHSHQPERVSEILTYRTCRPHRARRPIA